MTRRTFDSFAMGEQALLAVEAEAQPARVHRYYALAGAALAGAILALTACAVVSVKPVVAPIAPGQDFGATVAVAVEATLQARGAAVTPVAVPRFRFDDDFASNTTGWPDAPDGNAGYADSGYRMRALEPGKFVAVDAPSADAFHDGVISARFHKVGGPSGGGYGLIVADQGPDVHDGTFQGGRFIVAEASDVGTFGIWQREQDHWIDLVPWTPTGTVQAGNDANELSLRAEGRRLTFSINGTDVGDVDTNLPAGRVGVFVGGDGNEVALEHFAVEWPTPTAARTPRPLAPVTTSASGRSAAASGH
jgi:hypothetical protein